MARGTTLDDATTLQMALVGYQLEKQRIETRIQEIQSQLKGRRVVGLSSASSSAPRRRELSAEARARIADAQKRRWAEHRKRAAQAAKGGKSAPKVAAAS